MEGGTVVHEGGGIFTYTPATGFSGSDSFTYRLTDGFQTSKPITVSINVAPAVIVAWNNPAGGSWTTASNWTPARVPTSTDTAVINLPGTYTVTISSGTQTPASVQVGGTGATVILNHTAGTLAPVASSRIKPGSTYQLAGGTLSGTQPFTLQGAFTWTGGTMSGSGRTIVAVGVTATLSTTGAKTISESRILENRGTATLSGTAITFGAGTGRVINASGASFEVQSQSFQSNVNGSGPFVIENAGRFRKTGTGTSIISSSSTHNVQLQNTGTVQVEGGTLQVNSAGSLGGSFDLAAGTKLLVSAATTSTSGLTITGQGILEVSGTLTLVEALTVNQFTLSAGGTLNGSGDLTVTGGFAWPGGTMSGSGRTIIAAGVTATLSSTGTKTISESRVFENRGSATLSGTAITFGAGTGRIINASGATFEVQSQSFQSNTNGSGPFVIENAGLFRKTGTGTSVISPSSTHNVQLQNTGTVQVEGGTLQINSSGSLGGAFDLATGTKLLVSAATTSASGLSITGQGVLEVAGTLTLAEALTVNQFTLSGGGTLNGSGDLTVTGGFVWTGGTMSGSGRTIIATGVTATLSTTGTKIISESRVFENRGSATLSGTAITFGAGTGRIINASGSSFEVQSQSFQANTNGSGPFVIENAGLFRKTGTGTSIISSSSSHNVQLQNTGIVQVEGGTLMINSGGGGSGLMDVAAGATLSLASGTFNFTADATFSGTGILTMGGNVTFANTFDPAQSLSISAGSVSFDQNQSIASLSLSGGTLTGGSELTVTQSFNWTGGTMGGSGRTILGPVSVSTLSGAGTKALSQGRILENQGTLTYSGSGLTFGIGINGGTMRIINRADASFEFQGTASVNSNGSGTYGFDNEGLIRKTGTGVNGFANNSPTPVNSGLIQLEGGTLSLGTGFSQTASGEVRLAGGALSSGSTITFANGRVSGAGTITANVINSGAVISPDNTGTRTITISGTYTQQLGGTLELDLDGTAASGAFDKLAITGAATFNGTLGLRNSVALTNELFTLLTHGSRTGTFPTIVVENNGSATPSYLATRSDFTVTADEPPLPAPQLASTYEEWVVSVEETWGDNLQSGATATEQGGRSAAAAPPPPSWDNDPHADPDRDGSTNLLEYAFQTNPLDAGSAPRMTIGPDPLRNGQLKFSCLRRSNARDIAIVLESSSDMKTWWAEAWKLGMHGPPECQQVGKGIERVEVPLDSAASPACFLRWNVRSLP